MTDHADAIATKAVISGVEPQLFVADVRSSCMFFADKLGFTIVFTYGEPPHYAQVERDRARINLRCADRPVIEPDLRDREELLSATLVVSTTEHVGQLALEFQEAAVSFAQTLTENTGARSISLSAISTAICCCSRGQRIADQRRPRFSARAALSRDALVLDDFGDELACVAAEVGQGSVSGTCRFGANYSAALAAWLR